MDLSIVIVNYNVRYFLEQCLISVKNSLKDLDCEVFVVDNNSIDGSVELVKEKFPWVKLIESKENLGFSKGNNLAIRKAKGQYILLLNPDTVLEEDTLTKTVSFMNKHENAGGLGVKMINGKGDFLPESKRGLPTPKIAFYKIFGLSNLFPKSKKFGAYHLTYLDKEKNHEIDVLSGAFMLLKKEALDKVGLLDEDFFMYGEDIDLSYRITQAGYKNYYCADTTIIHYKGESTKKSSINYVVVFYKAMKIFAQKHFLSNDARLFSSLINLAINLRAALSISKRIISSLILPFIDYTLIFTGLHLIKNFYQEYSGISYPESIANIGIIFYSFIWCISIFLSGGYDKPISLKSTAKGIIYGLITILTIYSLVGEEYRFSRAIILLGSLFSLTVTYIIRLTLDLLKIPIFRLNNSVKKNVAIVSSNSEFHRIVTLLNDFTYASKEIRHIESNKNSQELLVSINENINVFKINEIVFSGNDNSSHEIIKKMGEFSTQDISFKIVPKLQKFIIGSDSIETTGDIYNALKNNKISNPKSTRDKRILDVIISSILLVAYPLIFIFYKNRTTFLKNLFQVFVGTKSFVGYEDAQINPLLPKIKSGILAPPKLIKKQSVSDDEINLNYATNYSYITDVKHVFSHIHKLDSIV